MGAPATKEVHDYIDEICRNEFYGTLSIKIERGVIEGIEQKLSLRLADIRSILPESEASPRRRLVIVRRPAEPSPQEETGKAGNG